MRLAKPRLDLGLFTNRIGDHRRFWGETLGLSLDHELEMEPGWVQHRFDAYGSVIKVNHRVDVLPDIPPSGYVGLTIVSTLASAEHRDPDGNAVRTVSRGVDGIERIGITVRSPDPNRMMAFYVDVLEFERVGVLTARAGDTLLFVEQGAGGSDTAGFIGLGYRYLTIQIFDADRALREISSRGGRIAGEAVSFKDVARYGLVKDPDGNWIEISARASLTGIKPI